VKKAFLISASLLLVVVFYAGCAGSGGAYSSKAAADSTYYDSGYPAPEAAPSSYMDAVGGAEYEMKEELSSVANVTQTSSENPAEGLKIIYTANMTVQTTDWDADYTSLMRLIDDNKGYIQSSNVSGGYTSTSGYYNERYANLSIRIPSDKYKSFLSSADGAIGTITNLEEYTDDITAAYIDTAARIKSLKTQENRLLSLLTDATNLTEIIELESKLGDIRYQIESYQSIMNTYNNLLSYSTITVNIREVSTVVIPKDTFGQRIVAALAGSWDATLKFFDGLVITLIYLLPFAIIALVIILVIRRLTRKKRLLRKERKALAKQQMEQNAAAHNQYMQQPPAQ